MSARPLMRRMNSMFARAPGRVVAHRLHVPVDGDAGRRVVPGERQVRRCGSGRASSSSRGGSSPRPTLQRSPSSAPSASVRVELDLQGADAGRQVDDSVDACGGDRLGEGVDPKAQREVEHDRPVLDEHVLVAGRGGTSPAGGRRRRRAGIEHAPWSSGRGAGVGEPPTGPVRRPSAALVTGAKRTVSPGRSWPSFQRSSLSSVTGQTNPPRLGPSGPRMIGMSPVKSTVPTA